MKIILWTILGFPIFWIIKAYLPILMLFLSLGYLYYRRKNIRSDSNKLQLAISVIFALSFTALCTSLIAFSTHIERGMDDGPFKGKKIRMKQQTFNESERIPYRRGDLIVYNRSEDLSPVLVYQTNAGRKIWSRDLDIKNRRKYKVMHLQEIKNLKLKSGILRDEVSFEAQWTFGKEHGRAYLWKFNRFQRFYLSW